MTIEFGFGFRNYDDTQSVIMQAAASPLGGFTVVQDYDPVILDYRRMRTRFWQMIPPGNKKPARSPTVQKMKRDKRAKIGFVNRMDLSGTQHNRKEDLALNLQDPGQPVRAMTASLDFSHFGRSMARQQGYPYGDEIAENTDDMLKEAYRFLEMSLFNSVNTPESPHAFNGLQAQQTEGGHVWRVDTMAETPDSIVDTVNEICMRAATDRNNLRTVSHLLFTGAAYTMLQKEVKANSIKVNEVEIVPGVVVPAIQTGDGLKPIVTTPYLDDVANEGNRGTNDLVRIYPIDMDCVEWHGVVPDGGTDTFEPQIFDMTAGMYASSQPLTLKRMLLQYGTPYLLNEGLWRIDIVVPRGKAWSLSQEAEDVLQQAA
jgi:hypothetical protein